MDKRKSTPYALMLYFFFSIAGKKKDDQKKEQYDKDNNYLHDNHIL